MCQLCWLQHQVHGLWKVNHCRRGAGDSWGGGGGLYLLYPPKGLRGSLASHLGTHREGREVRTATWAGMSTIARGRFWWDWLEFLILWWACPFLCIRTKTVTDHHLSLHREVSHCGGTHIYVYGLEPLGPNKRPRVEKKSIKVFENFSVSNIDEVLHLLAKRRFDHHGLICNTRPDWFLRVWNLSALQGPFGPAPQPIPLTFRLGGGKGDAKPPVLRLDHNNVISGKAVFSYFSGERY